MDKQYLEIITELTDKIKNTYNNEGIIYIKLDTEFKSFDKDCNCIEEIHTTYNREWITLDMLYV